MKKRTKITLTIVGLLALTGALYAANPSPFVTGIPFPTSVAAAPDLLLVSEYCADPIDKVDCQGNVSFFADIPGIGDCREKSWLSLHRSPRRPGSPRATFSSHKAIWSIRPRRPVPSRCLRRSRNASQMTTAGLRSTILAHWLRPDRNVPRGRRRLCD